MRGCIIRKWFFFTWFAVRDGELQKKATKSSQHALFWCLGENWMPMKVTKALIKYESHKAESHFTDAGKQAALNTNIFCREKIGKFPISATTILQHRKLEIVEVRWNWAWIRLGKQQFFRCFSKRSTYNCVCSGSPMGAKKGTVEAGWN